MALTVGEREKLSGERKALDLARDICETGKKSMGKTRAATVPQSVGRRARVLVWTLTFTAAERGAVRRQWRPAVETHLDAWAS